VRCAGLLQAQFAEGWQISMF